MVKGFLKILLRPPFLFLEAGNIIFSKNGLIGSYYSLNLLKKVLEATEFSI